VLRVEDLSLSFRGIRALHNVSFTVEEGSVTALIGPNGAGKTTLFNCVSGLVSPNDGDIRMNGRNLRGISPSRLIVHGIARTFQHAALFSSLSVRDNVRVGYDAARSAGRGQIGPDDALSILGLGADRDRAIDSLPLGTRKRVEIARAIATSPRLLLLDEPAGGLTHEEVSEMRETLLSVKSQMGLTILLVEHHVNMVMTMSDHIVVLSSGEVISAGHPAAVQSDPRVVAAYLGQ
jgi:branched-chain amino acid transport system ATP-binding protein